MKFTAEEFMASVRETYQMMQALHKQVHGESIRHPDFEAAMAAVEEEGLPNIVVRPPSMERVKNAMMTLLGGLPNGWDIRFFWENDRQCMTIHQPGMEPEKYALVRKENGSGHFITH